MQRQYMCLHGSAIAASMPWQSGMWRHEKQSPEECGGRKSKAQQDSLARACDGKGRQEGRGFARATRSRRGGGDKNAMETRWLRAYLRLGGVVMPSCYWCQVVLANCWRLFFLVLPKLNGCQVVLPNCWSCSKIGLNIFTCQL
jgi:hypothetical protein